MAERYKNIGLWQVFPEKYCKNLEKSNIFTIFVGSFGKEVQVIAHVQVANPTYLFAALSAGSVRASGAGWK